MFIDMPLLWFFYLTESSTLAALALVAPLIPALLHFLTAGMVLAYEAPSQKHTI